MLSARAARVVLVILVAVAVANVLIVLLLSSYTGTNAKPANHKDQPRDILHSVGELDDGKTNEKETKDETFDLFGNPNFQEDKPINDPNETDWRLKRNAPISRKELTEFLQTKAKIPGCRDKSIFLITFVISSPYNIYHRNAIRDSWGKMTRIEKKNVMTIFVMGKHPDPWNHGGVISLEKEISKYRDILKGKFKLEKEEGRTSLKILLGLQWIRENCRRVSYLLVVHDTMFVNYRRLVRVLKYRESQDDTSAKIWVGNVQKNQLPIRDVTSSHYISESQFNGTVYPPFCSSSAGYAMSMASARELYNAALTRVLFPFIDIFTGVVARDGNWTIIHNSQLFTTGRVHTKPCTADRLATAVAPENKDVMIQITKQLENFTALRNCMDPDLELVLPTDINNEPFLSKVLVTAIDHPKICFTSSRKPRNVFMVVLISSSPENFEVRNAIRRTWGADHLINGELLRMLFVLGKPGDQSTEMRTKLKTEDARYKDIVQGNFIDSFQNLTLKIILGLKWITRNCPHAAYLYKGDEDMFVNFKNIVHYLKKLRANGEATGNFFIGSKIFGNRRFSPENEDDAYFKKFHVSDKLYRGHYYPPYCSGGGYILSTDTVPRMYKEAMRTPIIGVADAFQGILAKRIGLEAIGHRGFKDGGGNRDACSLRRNDTMNIHGIGKSAKSLYDLWNVFTNDTIKCTSIWDE